MKNEKKWVNQLISCLVNWGERGRVNVELRMNRQKKELKSTFRRWSIGERKKFKGEIITEKHREK
jgi:hypothetical protein